MLDATPILDRLLDGDVIAPLTLLIILGLTATLFFALRIVYLLVKRGGDR